MFGPVHLPPILPAHPMLYAVLRKTHTILAFLLFFTFLAHLTAVLFHTLVIRDGLLNRMVPWTVRSVPAEANTNPKSGEAQTDKKDTHD
jgi:cytochrome b561